MAFVADNSVIVAWFVASQASAENDALLDRAAVENVHVPLIWRAELAATPLAARDAPLRKAAHRAGVRFA